MGNTCSGQPHSPNFYSMVRSQHPAMFTISNLPKLNKYTFPPHNQQYTDPRITTNQEAFDQFQEVIGYLSLTDSEFSDANFRIRQNNDRLNNMDKRHLKPNLLENSSSMQVVQSNDQYTYLSAVLCYVADNANYFKHIFCTVVNKYHLYIVSLYPNGKQTFVAVDNYIPIVKENLSYSSSKKAEIWMCILEKAWAKLIGSYERAKALSPEDALEEILGIPAYSYEIQRQDRELEAAIKDNKKQNCCVLFVAKSLPQQVRGKPFSRQVFYLEGFERIDNTQFYRLICPYDKFSIVGTHLLSLQSEMAKKLQYSQRENSNLVYLTPDEIPNYFDFCTIGYFKPGYTTRAQQLQFLEQGEVKYLKMRIEREQEINIRICQFYEGYVQDNSNYSYSSVYIRVWNLRNKNLISQGCRRSPYFTKSSNVLSSLFQKLQPGEYLISIDIPWKFQSKVNKANIVTYSKSPIKLQEMSISQGYNTQVQLLIDAIPYQQFNREVMLQYAIHWKRNSVFLLVSNITSENFILKVNLKNSSNLIPINYSFQNKEIIIQLPQNGKSLVEFKKVNVEATGELGKFVFQII